MKLWLIINKFYGSAIAFSKDQVHCPYDKEQINLVWKAMVRSHLVFSDFRPRFTGKSSLVHFFWGASDLAVSRFLGRRAPVYTGAIPNLLLWITGNWVRGALDFKPA